MGLAIEDGDPRGRVGRPRRAVPLRPPRDLAAALGMLAATLGIALFEVRAHVPVVAAKTIDAVDVTADDLDAMREFLREVALKDQSEETKAATQEFNQLIQDLAERRLDRTEAFRRMQALEDRLLEGREADKKAPRGRAPEDRRGAQEGGPSRRPRARRSDSKNLRRAAEEP